MLLENRKNFNSSLMLLLFSAYFVYDLKFNVVKLISGSKIASGLVPLVSTCNVRIWEGEGVERWHARTSAAATKFIRVVTSETFAIVTQKYMRMSSFS